MTKDADDIILSTKADVTCPDEVANWEDTTGATNLLICAEDITSKLKNWNLFSKI